MNLIDEAAAGGTQSIDRALALLLQVGRCGAQGARPADLVSSSGLPSPTVRRLLKALVKAGLLDQDQDSRRYYPGPEIYVLGLLATQRFGIHAMASEGLARLSRLTGDSAFLSVPRDTQALCLHREEGAYPIRTHVLQTGDRHPLGVGAGSLAILAALPDEEVERVIAANAEGLARDYPTYTLALLRELVGRTRTEGYALNPGMRMPGSWGVGVAVHGPDGGVAGALSIAAIESRFEGKRLQEMVQLLATEAEAVERRLREPSGRQVPPGGRTTDAPPRAVSARQGVTDRKAS